MGMVRTGFAEAYVNSMILKGLLLGCQEGLVRGSGIRGFVRNSRHKSEMCRLSLTGRN